MDDCTTASKTYYFFIELEKSENHYSSTTRYRDYAISPEEFHWESQATTREASDTGQRYIHHRRRGSEVFLFVRQTRKVDGTRTTSTPPRPRRLRPPHRRDANGRHLAPCGSCAYGCTSETLFEYDRGRA